jgi:hypothetical protein
LLFYIFNVGNMIVITHLGFRLPADRGMTTTQGAAAGSEDEHGARVPAAPQRTESDTDNSNSGTALEAPTPYTQLKETCALLEQG